MWRREVKNMEKKTLLIIGLIGGIIAAVGVFLPWQSVLGINISGWDVTATASYPYVILLGGILALIGARCIGEHGKGRWLLGSDRWACGYLGLDMGRSRRRIWKFG
jgi:hypothetical protein